MTTSLNQQLNQQLDQPLDQQLPPTPSPAQAPRAGHGSSRPSADLRTGVGGPVRVLAGPVLLAGVGDEPGLAAHRRRWPAPSGLTVDQLLALVRPMQVRGRGGAGFPFATKLSTAAESGRRRAVVVNAAEGEPGSAKDSTLMLVAPHLVLDGATLAAQALGVDEVAVVVAAERPSVRQRVEEAIRRHDGPVGFTLDVARGFVGGQARAVIEMLSGRDNLPVTAWTPEAVKGLGNRPTLLSNAETFAQVGALAALGAAEYGRWGTPDEPGTTLLTIAGDGMDGGTGLVAEAPFGVGLAEILAASGHARGPAGELPGALIGGYHGTWLTSDQLLRLRLSHEELTRAGASIGAGVILPLPAEVCPVQRTAQIVGYLAGQSAGRCGPCAHGLPALADAVRLLAFGHAGEAVVVRLRQLVGLLPGRGACAHPDGTVRLVRSLLRAFPTEVALHVTGACSGERGGISTAHVPQPAPYAPPVEPVAVQPESRQVIADLVAPPAPTGGPAQPMRRRRDLRGR